MKRKGFTVVEVLIASTIFSLIVILGMGIISLMTESLYTGQTESSDRSDLSDTVFYITREIQSAEHIKVENSGKKLSIKESGSDGFNLVYEFMEGHPTDTLNFREKKLMDVDYDKSSFVISGKSIILTIAVDTYATGEGKHTRTYKLTVSPRAEEVITE